VSKLSGGRGRSSNMIVGLSESRFNLKVWPNILAKLNIAAMSADWIPLLVEETVDNSLFNRAERVTDKISHYTVDKAEHRLSATEYGPDAHRLFAEHLPRRSFLISRRNARRGQRMRQSPDATHQSWVRRASDIALHGERLQRRHAGRVSYRAGRARGRPCGTSVDVRGRELQSMFFFPGMLGAASCRRRRHA
jgi:hypothetical protein